MITQHFSFLKYNYLFARGREDCFPPGPVFPAKKATASRRAGCVKVSSPSATPCEAQACTSNQEQSNEWLIRGAPSVDAARRRLLIALQERLNQACSPIRKACNPIVTCTAASGVGLPQ
jgi:hypothetical protein